MDACDAVPQTLTVTRVVGIARCVLRLLPFFFFKQKTAYEIGLGIPAEPLFRSKAPWMPDRTEANPNELNQDDARYGFRCCHLKNIWTAPLPPETELSRQMTTSTTSIDIMGLQAAYANLHTDQE